MKFGFVASCGGTDDILEMAVEAERCGWDGFFTWDGITIGAHETFDPWAVLGAVAVRTRTIRIGAMVFSLPRRKPWEVARQALTVDHLSGGRLVLPVGLGAVDDGGYSRVSGEVTDRRARAERLDETLAFLAQAWTGETFSHGGAHYRAEDMMFRPLPVQRPRIPVWVVAAWPSERSMSRAAAWDGVIPQPRGQAMEQLTPADLAAMVAWVGQRRGGDAGSFDVVVEGELPEGRAAAREHVRALAAAGATWWVDSYWDLEHETPQTLLDRIRQGPPVT
ncbi:LLM class flavin-dependent oxidoreductase [Georgenia wangjunii]|uniref:LLM class flavin-dependent oxidoreductase n=1 Tax=Georgenia wangjunii TaxID=3117730 RepID=UPI002F264C19